jgi:hypothetical protein
MAGTESESPRPGLPPYCQSARFGDDEARARRVYVEAQELIRIGPRNDLSVYRTHFDLAYYVLALGEPPPRSLDRQLRRLLAAGESASLPDDLLRLLYARRQRAIQLGPWVERHHRP